MKDYELTVEFHPDLEMNFEPATAKIKGLIEENGGKISKETNEGKKKLAARAKELNLDAIHDTVHEMARDEARHGKAFQGLLERYFG